MPAGSRRPWVFLVGDLLAGPTLRVPPARRIETVPDRPVVRRPAGVSAACRPPRAADASCRCCSRRSSRSVSGDSQTQRPGPVISRVTPKAIATISPATSAPKAKSGMVGYFSCSTKPSGIAVANAAATPAIHANMVLRPWVNRFQSKPVVQKERASEPDNLAPGAPSQRQYSLKLANSRAEAKQVEQVADSRSIVGQKTWTDWPD